MSKTCKPSFRKFLFIWSGQLLSILGSGISSFGLSVWMFEQTGAVTPFALSFLCSILPALLFSPIAGSFADRKNRKAIIMLTDTADAVLKVGLAILLFTNSMRVWMIYPFMFLSSTLGTFQSPAFSASIPMLVEEKHLGRANGMRQLAGAAQSMVAPILAGVLYPLIAVEGLLIVDLCSYLFAIITVALIPIPQPELTPEANASKNLIETALKDFTGALQYLRGMPRLFVNVLVFAMVNFIANMALILISPMILARYDTTVYSLSQTVAGIAMIAGSVVASILPSPKNKFVAIYATLMVSGLGLIVGSLSPHWVVICVGIFLFALFVPYVNALSSTMIQTMVEPSMLGRVDSAVNVLCQIMMPVSSLLAGPLADNLFGPMMREDGILGGSFFGRLIGVGADRGSAVVFLLGGLGLMILCFFCLLRSISYTQECVPALSESVTEQTEDPKDD
ncbi:MAG: MFS transporter [Clostridia bacterium]|nr:MFS transporter [Clostridia bacterium]